MGARAEFWRKHVVALNLAGVTSKAYADQHGLSVHSLRHWVQRFKVDASMVDAPQPGAFVALRLERGASPSSRASASAPGGCTLRCGSGWELDMTGLPSPRWLAAIVEQAFGANPFASSLHVFVNARRTKIKALYWHRNGFCLWYKRLERERFAWPGREVGATLPVTIREFEWLLEGFDLWGNKPHATLHYEPVT